MLAFPAAIKIFVAVQPTDMCKQFDGLWLAVAEQFKENPKNGAVFAFINKERTWPKLLHRDGTGVWVLARRLEKAASEGRSVWTKRSGRSLDWE